MELPAAAGQAAVCPLLCPCPVGEPVRVLHVINGEHYAGAERVQDLLAGGLGPLGFDVTQVCLKPGRFAELRQYKDIPILDVPMGSRFDLWPVLKLARIARRGGFQLIHSHSVRGAMVAGLASAISGIPLVHHIHSPTDHDTTHRWQDRANAWAERLGASRATALVAVSASLAEYARRQNYAADRVTVVPNGVPCRPLVPERAGSKTAWTLGMVALFRPRKGIEVLLRALALLRSQGLPVRLRAVGDFETADYGQQVKNLAGQLGLDDAIDWAGFHRDVDGQLAQMDLLVLPSLFGEGMPMVLLEAMSAGLPIVTTRVEGIPEAIRDGQEGLLASPGDSDDLARAISRVVSGQVDWHELRAACLRRHAERYSDVRMAADVAAVYRRVLAAVER
jgi:glycosyltransferase involved in cell wall biosynthesis